MTTSWQRLDKLSARAELYRLLRAYMAERGVLEVETPVLGLAANTDPQTDPLSTQLVHPRKTGRQRYYLHISPEFAMKRLLAEGSGAIYQICKVFRDAEYGAHHQPEFSMLEWYRPQVDEQRDHHALMAEINGLLQWLGLPAADKISYQACFQQRLGLDPHRSDSAALARRCQQLGLAGEHTRRASMLDFLFSHQVCPQLGVDRPVFVYDYPACQAALARIRPNIGPDAAPVAERFELFINGLELANGYYELTDADEQRRRFQAENAYRKQAGLAVLPLDDALLAALRQGLPACSGVAVGLDRLLMVLTGSRLIGEVLSFPPLAE